MVARLKTVSTPRELAAMLGVSHRLLTFHLYKVPMDSQYASFDVPKRGGGSRAIQAPRRAMKTLQRSLLPLLEELYKPKASVHGFVAERSIVTNAKCHVSKRLVFNIDLESFFPSINFGRVRGLLMCPVYGLAPAVATCVAQICCYRNSLAQGAPTSPIISNMICGALDSQLRQLTVGERVTYSRYADDITFSTGRRSLPRDICEISTDSAGKMSVVPGSKLLQLVADNGFALNPSKTRIQSRRQRQVVTGLTCNEKPNVTRRFVRRVRALLHSWRCMGPEAALAMHLKSHPRHRGPHRGNSSLPKLVDGYLAYLSMVRGPQDAVVTRLRSDYNRIRGQEAAGTAQQASVEPDVVRRPSRHQRARGSVFLVESEDEDNLVFKQGTAFMVSRGLLVTCAHVLGPKNSVSCPDFPGMMLDSPVVVYRDDERDLAILRVHDRDWYQCLEIDATTEIQHLDDVFVLGYPRYHLGDTIQIRPGKVSGFRVWHGQRRFMTTGAPIVAGNSGGPVTNQRGAVIGVAVTGSDREETADDTSEHGVIMIESLTVVLAAANVQPTVT